MNTSTRLIARAGVCKETMHNFLRKEVSYEQTSKMRCLVGCRGNFIVGIMYGFADAD